MEMKESQGDVSTDPSILGDFNSMLWRFRQKTLEIMQVAMPCIVEEYDRESHYALVRPLPRKPLGNGKQEDRASFWIPVRRVQLGGFLVDFPLFVGDVGWVIASDRGTYNVRSANCSVQGKETGIGSVADGNRGPQDVEHNLTHQYLDGFFLPDSWASIDVEANNLTGKETLPKVAGTSYADSLVMQRIGTDGKASSCVVFKPNGDVDVQSATGGRLLFNGHPVTPGNTSAFTYLDGYFTNCMFQYGRSFYVPSNAGTDGKVEAKADGLYCLTIPASAPQLAEVKRFAAAEPSDLVHTVIPIARIEKEEMVQDFRGCPCVPVYETGECVTRLPTA